MNAESPVTRFSMEGSIAAARLSLTFGIKMETYTANSISQAIETAIEISMRWGSPGEPQYVWYRGVKDNTLMLQPGAYWRNKYHESEPLLDFTQNACAYIDTSTLDDWDLYFLAQHHGIPTRLLDWTESFLAAIYFATCGWDGETIPCVWIADPCKLNHTFIGWQGLIAPTNSNRSSLWLSSNVDAVKTAIDSTGFEYRNEFPLAIWPRRSNRRIVAQHGAFTVHGVRRESINELLIGREMQTIARIDLPSLSKTSLQHQLNTLGLRHASLYPDIDNYVKDLRDYYNWE